VPGAGHIAFHDTDGKDIDMPRRDLERIPAMVEKFRVTAIEGDMARRSSVSVLSGDRLGLLRRGVGHS
jgi:hypothetical protein